MGYVLVLSVIAGLLWLAVSREAMWQQRARDAEKSNKLVRKAQNVKNNISRDTDARQRVRDHFDAP